MPSGWNICKRVTTKSTRYTSHPNPFPEGEGIISRKSHFSKARVNVVIARELKRPRHYFFGAKLNALCATRRENYKDVIFNPKPDCRVASGSSQ